MSENPHYGSWLVSMAVKFILLLPMIALFISAGCAGGSNPVAPDDSTGINSVCPGTYISSTNRQIWGMWTVLVSDDQRSAIVIPLRSATMHLNAVKFLESDPCTTCLSVSNLVPYPDGRLSIDLTLIHPFPGRPKLSGFDVRGVFISDADYTFPVSGRKIAWESNLPRLLLPNGYTTLFNPVEYDPSMPGPDCLQYIPGTISRGSCDATLNGYIAYRREAPRRMFEPGGCETRTVWLEVPAGGFEFGYVVDCCWQKFDGPCIDPLVDFPPDANCLEAYNVDVRLGSNLQSIAGSTQPIEVQVFDHQGLDTVSAVIVEAPELFSGEVRLEYLEDVGIQTHMFVGTIENEYGVGAGMYPMVVHVIDTEEDQNLGQIDAWFLYRVEVGSRRGWVRTWGSETPCYGYSDYARAVAVDSDGNIYVTGTIRRTTDLDPGPGIDMHPAYKHGVFLSKFSTNGEYIWGLSWNGPYEDYGRDVVVDFDDNVLVTMKISHDESIDLDPGPGVDMRDPGSVLCKLDPNGCYIWGRSWDLGLSERCLAVDSDSNIYLGGSFYKQADMNPGDAEDNRWALGIQDICLIKMNSEGGYTWSRTFGGKGNIFTDNDAPAAVAADLSGHVYIAGWVGETTDFDPGENVVEHESGYFLSKFAPTGKFLGVNVWEGTYQSLAVDRSNYLYITGKIYSQDIVDFDTGPGVNEYHGPCSYVARYAANGDFLWVRTWGLGLVSPYDITVSVNGEVFVTGNFYWNLVDFDPSEYTDYQSAVAQDDAFVTKFLANGEYQWTRTWGGYDDEYACGVASDESGNVYVCGQFIEEVDFDPGPGVEYHTDSGCGDAYLIKLPPDGNW